MIPWQTIFGFATASFVIAVSPGPSWIYVISTTVKQNWLAGLLAIAGNGIGILCHVLAAAFGVSALLAYWPTAYTLLKWTGACYLVYLGLKMIWHRTQPKPDAVQVGRRRLIEVFREGMLVNLLNPKVAILMLSLLPQFVDPSRGNLTVQTIGVGLIHVLIASSVLGSLVLITSRSTTLTQPSQRTQVIARCVCGSILIGLAIQLALGGKPGS